MDPWIHGSMHPYLLSCFGMKNTHLDQAATSYRQLRVSLEPKKDMPPSIQAELQHYKPMALKKKQQNKTRLPARTMAPLPTQHNTTQHTMRARTCLHNQSARHSFIHLGTRPHPRSNARVRPLVTAQRDGTHSYEWQGRR